MDDEFDCLVKATLNNYNDNFLFNVNSIDEYLSWIKRDNLPDISLSNIEIFPILTTTPLTLMKIEKIFTFQFKNKISIGIRSEFKDYDDCFEIIDKFNMNVWEIFYRTIHITLSDYGESLFFSDKFNQKVKSQVRTIGGYVWMNYTEEVKRIVLIPIINLSCKFRLAEPKIHDIDHINLVNIRDVINNYNNLDDYSKIILERIVFEVFFKTGQ